MKARGQVCQCIRCREVRGEKVDAEALVLQELAYETDTTREHFLSFVTPAKGPGQALPLLAGFLRLSFPLVCHSEPRSGEESLSPEAETLCREATRGDKSFLDEIAGAAMIRETHVYGPALEIGQESEGQTQHAGLGTRLIERAVERAREAGFTRLAVIAATGTRNYYRARGFRLGELYMTREL
jgi:elongator complex protein 3